MMAAQQASIGRQGRSAMSERNVLGMQVQLALAAAVIAALAVPVLAQSGGGIAGVLPAGAVPELVKEGFVGTEGPVGTADAALHAGGNVVQLHEWPLVLDRAVILDVIGEHGQTDRIVD